MLVMLILALGVPLGVTVTIPLLATIPVLATVPLLASCSTASSLTVWPNTSVLALRCWPLQGPPVERMSTPVPHLGDTLASSWLSAFFFLKHENSYFTPFHISELVASLSLSLLHFFHFHFRDCFAHFFCTSCLLMHLLEFPFEGVHSSCFFCHQLVLRRSRLSVFPGIFIL